jgi:hypothetical protein
VTSAIGGQKRRDSPAVPAVTTPPIGRRSFYQPDTSTVA